MLKYTLFDTFLSPLLLATFKILIKQVKYPKTEKLSLLYQEMCVFSYLATKTYYNCAKIDLMCGRLYHSAESRAKKRPSALLAHIQGQWV